MTRQVLRVLCCASPRPGAGSYGPHSLRAVTRATVWLDQAAASVQGPPTPPRESSPAGWALCRLGAPLLHNRLQQQSPAGVS